MDRDRYEELLGRIDAAETVMRFLLRHVAFRDADGEDRFKADVLEYANGIREKAKGNHITLAQARAMDGYVGRVHSD